MKDILVNGRYRIDRKIGAGGFGLVYAGIDMNVRDKLLTLKTDTTQLDDEVAIKLMLIRDGGELLRTEAEAYVALSGGIGIPWKYA